MPETCPETIWRSVFEPDIPSPEATLCLGNTHCVSGRHIVSPEDTLCLWKIHCVSGRHIVSCVSTMIVARRSPVARSLGRSLARSLARSIDHSLARSLARSIARSLTDMCSLQSQYKGGGLRPPPQRGPRGPLCGFLCVGCEFWRMS